MRRSEPVGVAGAKWPTWRTGTPHPPATASKYTESHACACIGYEDSPGGCPQRSTSLLTDANVGTAAVPRPYRPGYV